MRVLFVTTNPFLRSTTSSLNAIIRGLQPRGLRPVMVFREPGPWTGELAADGIPCHFHPLRLVEKTRPLRAVWDTVRLARLIRRARIELVHCNEHDNYPAVRLAARRSGVPVVVTHHYKVEPDYTGWLYRPPYTPAALQFISRAQLDYCRPGLPPGGSEGRVKLLMSGLAIDDFVARGGPDAADRLRAEWGIGPNTTVVGTASAIRPYKHLDQFVRLVARLRGRGLDVRGVIAGGGRFADPAYEVSLRGLIRETGLDGHCRLLGNLDPLTPFLKAIDVFVSTSEWETFGMSICEAQACGTPTLTYAVGGNPEALPDPWCAAPFGDLDGLEEKAAKLITEPAFRRDLGDRAGRFVREHFDAPVLADRQAAVYEEVLGRPLTPAPAGELCRA